MRIVTVDTGNSKTKVGIFENKELVTLCHLDEYTNQLKEANDIILLSNVTYQKNLTPHLDFETLRVQNHFLNLKINYSKALGIDRLLCAFKVALDNSVRTLLIDAGTFMTVDLIEKNEFLGGYIFLGIETYLKSFSIGAKLPVIDYFDYYDSLPQSTPEAILGATNMYLEGVLESAIKKMAPEMIVITGGHGEYILNITQKINSKIPLKLKPDLIHHSMLEAYDYHLKHP